jgi:formate hydrogenlyase subunit 6/NADH:ubiquinone oxidoreductase subunit I
LAKIPYIKEAIKNVFQSPVTNKYPHVKPEVPKDYRGKLKFNPDLCVGCGMCMRVCSPSSITKDVKNIEDAQEITLNFDMTSCTFCKMCADFCAKKAIDFTQEYSLIGTADDRSAFMVSGTFVKKLPPKPAPKPVPPAGQTAAAAAPAKPAAPAATAQTAAPAAAPKAAEQPKAPDKKEEAAENNK